MAEKALKNSIKLALISQYGDDAGNISWSSFSATVGKLIKDRAEGRAPAPVQGPANGLGV